MALRIGVTGATGFLGRHFAAAARNSGHTLIGYSRSPRSHPSFAEMRPWLPIAQADFSGLDAVVHLAGEPILGLWTKRKKEVIRQTRVNDTCAMVARLREQCPGLRALVSAGGIAYYGDRGEEAFDETAPPGVSYLAEVARAWEDAAATAQDFTRVVTLRIGMVLGQDGGAGVILRRIFSLGLGGRLGRGQQWFPWIHVTDLARLFLYSVEHDAMRGPANAVAPGLTRNLDFTRAMGRAVRRPALFPVPAFVLKALPGGMSEIFLTGQRATPAVAQRAGFQWLHPEIGPALNDLFS
jgi:uncharacterized protein